MLNIENHQSNQNADFGDLQCNPVSIYRSSCPQVVQQFRDCAGGPSATTSCDHILLNQTVVDCLAGSGPSIADYYLECLTYNCDGRMLHVNQNCCKYNGLIIFLFLVNFLASGLISGIITRHNSSRFMELLLLVTRYNPSRLVGLLLLIARNNASKRVGLYLLITRHYPFRRVDYCY